MANPFTERQREVIGLAASGLTNRQIAARLVMSVRTVEGHLFRASQRAGISTREGLIALLEGRADRRPDKPNADKPGEGGQQAEMGPNGVVGYP